MIADLMDFAMIKEPTLQQSDVKAIVVQALSQASLPNSWEIIMRLDDSLPLLMADVIQLQRAFTNIILRIVEGMPEGGKLEISARKQDGFVEVGFGAAGLIISEENLAVAAAPSVSLGGTSLGMAVSNILVEGHRGTIGVQRLAGSGMVFVVRLPL
jgi:signal transduction histidine kinase